MTGEAREPCRGVDEFLPHVAREASHGARLCGLGHHRAVLALDKAVEQRGRSPACVVLERLLRERYEFEHGVRRVRQYPCWTACT